MAWLFYFEGIAIFHVLFEGPDLVMQLTVTPTEMHRQLSDFTHVDHKKSFRGRNVAPVTSS